MPELPEVETIKRELLTQLIGIKIIKVIILRPEIIGYPEPEQFVKILRQTEIEDIVRKAKYLIFKLSNQQQLIFHLRLSGSLIITDRSSKPRYSRIQFFLSNNRILHFTEPRLLGRVYLIRENCRPEVLKGFFTLGREPIARNFDLDYLQNIIANRKACIKSLLLDQRIAAGVGNIYSDEALFQAGIRPTRRASTLSSNEVLKLITALKSVLKQGIKNLGTSVRDYYRTDGQTGKFQNLLSVYGREGEKCHRCGAIIKIIKLGNRGSRYCPGCQR